MRLQKNLLIIAVLTFFLSPILAQDTTDIQLTPPQDSPSDLEIDSVLQAQQDSILQSGLDSIARAQLALERQMEFELTSILERIPSRTVGSYQSDMEAIATLDTFGIQVLIELLDSRDPTQVEDAEFALGGLAKFLSGLPDNELKLSMEKAFCKALVEATLIEQQVFLIDQLQYFGSDYAVHVLSDYLIELCDPVVRTMVAIGTGSVVPSVSAKMDEIPSECRKSIVKALHRFGGREAIQLLKVYANDADADMARLARQSMARTADPAVYDVLSEGAIRANYDMDPTGSTSALLQYASTLLSSGNVNQARNICSDVWEKSPSSQLKAEAIATLSGYVDGSSTSLLKKVFKTGDPNTISAAIQIIENSNDINPAPFFKWINRSDPEIQAQLIHMAGARRFEKALPKLEDLMESTDPDVRIAALQAVSSMSGKTAVPELLEIIQTHNDERTIRAARKELDRWVDSTNLHVLDQAFHSFQGSAKASIIEMIADRDMEKHLDDIISLCASPDPAVSTSALRAAQRMISLDRLDPFLAISTENMGPDQKEIYVRTIVKTIEQESDPEKQSPLVFKALRNASDKSLILRTLIHFQTDLTFSEVSGNVFSSDDEIKKAATYALFRWKRKEAIPVLFDLLDKTEGAEKKDVLDGVIKSVSNIDIPDEQKLILLRKCLEYAPGADQVEKIILACGDLNTFTAFMFVSGFLDDEQLSQAAALATISIGLPDDQGFSGLSGDSVTTTLRKAVSQLPESESVYGSIKVQQHIDEMPDILGFYPLFNETDLTGWQGLVENPVARSNMTNEELMQKQKEADSKLSDNWMVRDGKIVFIGNGYDNLCTVKSFKDFELLVDWKISKNGDSGIYLRGSPQVQIWDTSLTEIRAFVGSGGLFNNQESERLPLMVADNPAGEWNTFLIRMIGDKVTVTLNGELVVDNVTMENYWDRSAPVFETGPIELQAHTTEVEFRDIYVRELENAQYPTKGEQAQGFVSLFNGINLDGWVGNKVDYRVENGTIVIRPGEGSATGNLYTKEEFDNFRLRFEFKLTPGANNGLGFHAPLEGDAAYLGKELQILDNTHEKWENLEDYQYHGSLYGVMPAAKGHLAPTGQWNRQEVTVRGTQVDVVLNGRLILSGDWMEASREGTLDGHDHPGLNRSSGHIGFLGHGDEVEFRNIRIQKLEPPEEPIPGEE